MTAGSQEQTLVTAIPVTDTSDEGQIICVGTAQTLSALKELPSQPITFAANDQTLQICITYQNGRFDFVGVDADNYPSLINTPEKTNPTIIPANILRSALNSTLTCVANDELRPQMNGVFFDFKQDGKLVCVASDGHKMCRDTYTDINCQEDFSFILSHASAQLLLNIIGKNEDDIQLFINDQKAVLQAGDYTLYTSLIEGRYPNYNSVIPTDNTFHARFDRNTLVSALRRVMVFANAASALVKLTLSENNLKLTASDMDFSTSSEESVCCDYIQQELSIGFNGTMLLELLKTMPPVELEFQLSSPTRAGIIVPVEQAENNELLMMLMPMMFE